MIQTELTTNSQDSMSDITQWLASNQSRLITAVVLLGVGLVLAFLLRVLAVRVVTAFQRAVPGRALRTSFAGVARDRRIAEIMGSVVSWAEWLRRQPFIRFESMTAKPGLTRATLLLDWIGLPLTGLYLR